MNVDRRWSGRRKGIYLKSIHYSLVEYATPNVGETNRRLIVKLSFTLLLLVGLVYTNRHCLEYHTKIFMLYYFPLKVLLVWANDAVFNLLLFN